MFIFCLSGWKKTCSVKYAKLEWCGNMNWNIPFFPHKMYQYNCWAVFFLIHFVFLNTFTTLRTSEYYHRRGKYYIQQYIYIYIKKSFTQYLAACAKYLGVVSLKCENEEKEKRISFCCEVMERSVMWAHPLCITVVVASHPMSLWVMVFIVETTPEGSEHQAHGAHQ